MPKNITNDNPYGLPLDTSNVVSGLQDPLVSNALWAMRDIQDEKQDRDDKNYFIRELFREGFTVSDPSGTKQIGSKVVQQVFWRQMARVKFLEYWVQGSGVSPAVERMVSDGIRTTAERGGLLTAFTAKGGVFHNLFLQADGFYQIGKNKDKGLPITYRAIKNECVYPDKYASGIRGAYPATNLSVVFSYPWQRAIQLYPKLKEIGTYGALPIDDSAQDSKKGTQQDLTEIAYNYNLNDESYTVFGGGQASILEQYQTGVRGMEDYPFTKRNTYSKKKENIIPVGQFMCMPSTADSFWNYGIGDMVYDLAIVSRRLFNMEVNHVNDNTYPLTFVSTSSSEKSDELLQKMAGAYKARAAGKRGIVAMDFGAGEGVNSQTLLSQNLASEWQILWDKLESEIAKLGLDMKDLDRGANTTAFQISSEDEASNRFTRQVQENNVEETRELIEMTMDAIVKDVPKSNKTIVNITSKIPIGKGIAVDLPKGKQITMGNVSEQLRKDNFFVMVNGRSGAISSNLFELTQVERQLAMTPPGTPEYQTLYQRRAELSGLDIAGGGDFAPKEGQQAPQVQGLPDTGMTQSQPIESTQPALA